MSEKLILPPKPLPRWLTVSVGLAVALHLTALLALVLAAPSGPWPTSFGSSLAVGPTFTLSAGNTATRYYLSPLKMTHNYHFPRNRPGLPGVFFEVRLKGATGEVIRTVRCPDPDAPFWVHHRQSILAQALADDQPVQARAGEVIPAPNQAVRTVEILDRVNDRTLALKTVPEHLVPRDRQVYRPSDWSLILARSYMRYLCRQHDAASAELIRHTREAVLPAMMFLDNPPPETFQELITYFGEIKK